nr:40S ribosomal protein S21-like [Nyctereutes procyonoides]
MALRSLEKQWPVLNEVENSTANYVPCGSKHALDTHNDAGKFVDMHQQQKCSTSNRNMGARGYVSIQIKVAEADQVTGRFHQQFKTYTVCGALCRMGESDDSILLLAKADGILSKNF